MATLNFFYPFIEDLAEGVHVLGTDQLTIALSATAPTQTWGLLSETSQVAYTNLSTRNITNSTSAQTTGTYKLKLTDLVLTATGTVATFRYIIIYNSGTAVKTNPLIGWYDAGSNITLVNGETYTIDFDGTNGVFTIAPAPAA